MCRFLLKSLNKYKMLLLFLCPVLLFAEEAMEGAAPAEAGGSSGVDFVHAVLSASIIVQITFLILIVMSVVSWAVILQKYFFFKEIQKSNQVLGDVFSVDGSFEEIYGKARADENSSLARIFVGGYNEMQKILKQNSSSEENNVRSLKGLDNIERALRKASENELSLMENGLSFLATTGNSCPFIGLFGTVFGIMNSFSKIAVMGSASLNVVAPGIAEALLATGAGLFAAIPASIFYNIYLTKIRRFDLQFSNFSTDFLNIAKRNFFQGGE